MDVRWVGPDGYEVVPGVLDGRQVLRVRRHGRPVADCRSVEEVARLVDLAELCEVVTLRPAAAAEPPTRAKPEVGPGPDEPVPGGDVFDFA
ncbi:transposase [Thermopolyspora sp. NPDC052614]|uniref:transposase n=1 Tax=Thermopolyspora sp. NPDC052614 TaxID=3155682 RepID=UPI0034122332